MVSANSIPTSFILNTDRFHAVGTQTTLTFPMMLDREEMIAAMCHAYYSEGQWEKKGEEGEEEEEDGAANKDGNSSTLRRRLFGQPERLVCS